MSQPTPGPADSSSQLTSVIWHSGALELPGELLTSLSRRIGRMRVCTNGYAAFAEICGIQRERRLSGRAPFGVPPGGPNGAVLVLVQPTQLAELPGVIDAIELYAPGTALWCYDRSANPKLRGVVSGDVQHWREQTLEPIADAPRAVRSPASVPSPAISMPTVHTRPVPEIAPRPVAPAMPQMRLVGVEDAPEPTTVRRSAGAPIGGQGGVLTEEELRMLLSDDPPMPPSRGGGGGGGGGSGGGERR